MVYLNFTNLDSETQERLLSVSKEDVESRSGTELLQFAETHDKDYDTLLEEEAMRNLYSYDFVFNMWMPKHTIEAHPSRWAFFMGSWLVFRWVEHPKTNLGNSCLQSIGQPQSIPIPYLTASSPFKNVPIKRLRHKPFVPHSLFRFLLSWNFWEVRGCPQIINNLKSCIMKAIVKKSLEIPAKKHPKKSVVKKTADASVDKTYSLVVNLWIFRYEYYREQTNTVPSEDWREQDPWKRVFFFGVPVELLTLWKPKNGRFIFAAGKWCHLPAERIFEPEGMWVYLRCYIVAKFARQPNLIWLSKSPCSIG